MATRVAVLVALGVCTMGARAGKKPLRADARLAPPPGHDLVGSEWYVQTALGPVQGVVMDNARVFLGMPYAMPPVGPLRWNPPVPAVPWGPTVYQGLYDPPGCLQVCGPTEQPPHVCPGDISENCLFLNVWTPRVATMLQPAPVILFIHGGAYKTGYAGGIYDGIVYDASAWVNQTGAVVVAINYRLGAMGFLYYGEDTTLQGNYGLMDQEMAMSWVHDNIAAFGGDPNRIIIIGQSAGAMSVASHLSRPASTGLYTGAVLHSEPFSLPFRDPPAGQDLANVFAQFANCSDGSWNVDWTQVEACLRSLDADSLITAQVAATKDVVADLEKVIDIFVPWVPTFGTAYLPVSPLAAFQSGQVVDVPIMVGTVANESNLFINFAFNSSIPEVEYEIVLDIILGLDAAPKVMAQYPVPNPPPTDYKGQVMAIGTDCLFNCPNRNATASVSQSTTRTHPIFMYWYNHVESFNPAAWGSIYPFVDCWPVVCHGSELIELFHPNYPQYGTNYTAAETALSISMQSYWAAFAANGVPGTGIAGEQVYWPPYNMTTRPVMVLEAGGVQVANDPHGPICNFWDTQIGYNFY